MFVAHCVGIGQGCHYTIGCNQNTFELPDSIKTMEDAIHYIKNDEHWHYDCSWSKVTIYEVVEKQVIDSNDIPASEPVPGCSYNFDRSTFFCHKCGKPAW